MLKRSLQVSAVVRRKLIRPSRRSFLLAGAGLIASPAIVRAGSMTLLGVGGKAAGGGVSTALDPSKNGPSQTLSNGNLTVTLNSTTGVFSSVLGTVGKSSGKFYMEGVTASGVTNSIIGISNIANYFANDFIGDSAGNIGWDADNRVLQNSATLTNIQTFSLGDTCCMAVDLSNSKIWFRTNGGNWNNDVIGNQNPATNTGGISLAGLAAGPYFPGVSLFNLSGNAWTVNFGNTAYAQAAPSGFGNWV